ncbi:GTPase Era [Candidatus Raskinella chloraquaticus]|jgi:GTPase|uniref:GTPase Era n=1 Tax=Candidatus Raskinella chloraquaticus TaxID=1951219 RepID=A0A1W9HRT6_9HYPH|nr:MAG: GTPase Era [Proteobacteria bacterium SG_bin8]
MTDQLDNGPPRRCGYVAMIGAPNAGKSTLVNALVGAKVSIVSHKVQTTRAIMRGIVMDGAAQIILVDTPGIFAPKRRLDQAMVRTAWNGAREAEIIALLIDAERGIDDANADLLDRLSKLPGDKILVLNKIDRVAHEKLLGLASDANNKLAFAATFMVSALKNKGLGVLTYYLATHMPEGPWLFPEDQISDLPMRMLAAEITREKLFERLHEELPYASTVETDSWVARKDGSVRIEQSIFVERESQRKIVLGKGGSTVKAISMSSRQELMGILDQTVHLFVHVKVREGWADDPERYREMGLEFPRS